MKTLVEQKGMLEATGPLHMSEVVIFDLCTDTAELKEITQGMSRKYYQR